MKNKDKKHIKVIWTMLIVISIIVISFVFIVMYLNEQLIKKSKEPLGTVNLINNYTKNIIING